MDEELKHAIQRAIDALTMVDAKTDDPRLGDMVHGFAIELHDFMAEEGMVEEGDEETL